MSIENGALKIAANMKVVALVSGGKDSSYNMMKCVAEGHEIVALANLHPKDKGLMDFIALHWINVLLAPSIHAHAF